MSLDYMDKPVVDKKIKLKNIRKFNLRRMLFILSMSFIHSSVCVLNFLSNNLNISSLGFLIFLMLLWFVNLSIFYIFLSKKIVNITASILSVALIFWVGSSIVFSAYYLEYYRLSIMFLLFGFMLIGAFRIPMRAFLIFVISIIIGYFFIFYSTLTNRPIQTDTAVEVIELLMFILVTIGVSTTVVRIIFLQRDLREQRSDLNNALSRVQELAVRDELSGLYNRRKIMELLNNQADLASSGEYQFSICYIDLDFFKKINDTYGHDVGDQVIQKFSQLSKDSIRSADFIGRIGGEEFVVICVNTCLQEALFIAERVRANMERECFSKIPKLNVTISVGVAQYKQGESVESLVGRADKQLYIAKDSGRNQVRW